MISQNARYFRMGPSAQKKSRRTAPGKNQRAGRIAPFTLSAPQRRTERGPAEQYEQRKLNQTVESEVHRMHEAADDGDAEKNTDQDDDPEA
jgi:hypothetical protein